MTTKARSPELMELAVGLYEKLGSGNAVAKTLGVCPNSAYRMLKSAGVDVPGREDPKPRRRKTSDQKAAEIVMDYVAGLSLVELTSKHKVGQWTIRASVKRAGLKLRKIGGRKRSLSESEKKEAIHLYKSGAMSQVQIARKLETHQGVISRLLRAAGMKSKWAASGPDHGSWSGGITTTPDGYIKEYVGANDALSKMGGANGYAFQHRLVVAQHVGRPLLSSETVHHINGDRADNRIENLQLRHSRHGKGVSMRCKSCGSTDIETSPL